nr:hypothetical protein HK105_007205 [Polyrhizophydium stewartii]
MDRQDPIEDAEWPLSPSADEGEAGGDGGGGDDDDIEMGDATAQEADPLGGGDGDELADAADAGFEPFGDEGSLLEMMAAADADADLAGDSDAESDSIDGPAHDEFDALEVPSDFVDSGEVPSDEEILSEFLLLQHPRLDDTVAAYLEMPGSIDRLVAFLTLPGSEFPPEDTDDSGDITANVLPSPRDIAECRWTEDEAKRGWKVATFLAGTEFKAQEFVSRHHETICMCAHILRTADIAHVVERSLVPVGCSESPHAHMRADGQRQLQVSRCSLCISCSKSPADVLMMRRHFGYSSKVMIGLGRKHGDILTISIRK